MLIVHSLWGNIYKQNMMNKMINLLTSIYIIIKKVVLIIFSFFYVFTVQLPRFIFIIVVFIIAFVAYHLDEDEEDKVPEQEQSNSSELVDLSKQPKPKNLLDWSEDDSESYPIENSSDKKEVIKNQDSITYEAMSSNLVAFYKNSFANLYPNSEVFVVHSGMAADLANNIKNKARYLTNDLIEEANEATGIHHNRFAWSPTMSEEDMEHIVSMFQNGSQISVFSPISENTQSTPASIERDPNCSPVSYNEPSKIEVTKPAVIIVTKKVKEGDPIPPLPSWIDLGFSHQDYHIKKNRLNTMFNNDYVNNNVDNTKPSDRNQEWLNNGQEDFYLDKGLGIDSNEKSDSNETK